MFTSNRNFSIKRESGGKRPRKNRSLDVKLEILRLSEKGESAASISRRFSLPQSTVRSIIRFSGAIKEKANLLGEKSTAHNNCELPVASTKLYRSLPDRPKTPKRELKWPLFIFFGDSLTQHAWDEEGGWLTLLASRFQRRADFINRGFLGYNTRLCLPLLMQLYPSLYSIRDCTLFFIFLGATDASLGEQRVELEEYKVNLSEMILYLTGIGFPKEKILLISPPPVNEFAFDACKIAQDEKPSRSLENTLLYADGCVEVAKNHGMPYVNLFKAVLVQRDWQQFFCDGFHFGRSGSNFLANVLTPIIEGKLPLNPIIPPWRELIHSELNSTGENGSNISSHNIN